MTGARAARADDSAPRDDVRLDALVPHFIQEADGILPSHGLLAHADWGCCTSVVMPPAFLARHFRLPRRQVAAEAVENGPHFGQKRGPKLGPLLGNLFGPFCLTFSQTQPNLARTGAQSIAKLQTLGCWGRFFKAFFNFFNVL